MTIMNIKVTFWRVVFVVIMLLGIYSTYIPLFPWPRRRLQHDRPIPLGALDWL